MGYEPRRLEKFENAAGTVSQAIPLFEYEWESSQGLKAPQAAAIGAHYGVDLLGTSPGVMDFGAERLRCLLYEPGGPSDVDDELDDLMSKLWSIGQGKLYTIDSAGDRRWAYARLRSMPTITWRAGDILSKGLALDFVRLSSWFSETQITDTETVTADGETWVVANPGNISATRGTIRIRSNSAAGFTNPKITNETTGDEFETARDASSANDEVKLDTTVPSVEYTSDNGVNYSDDYSNYQEPPVTQRLLSFSLAPGNNTLRLNSGGTVNCDVEVAFDAPFA